ncbi:tail fiber assembly protein [Kluyvera sichuanensis]|uniref:tail fiber assembly protein n=1 Tax=Kluyvera sichuanensis TaxID=2725494 RepID=UPI0039F470CC
MKIIYVDESTGRSWSTSPAAFDGVNYPVIVHDDFTGGAMTHNRLTNEWIVDPPYVPTHEDDVRDAEACRRNLITEAEKTMAGWILDLNLGLISDEDKQKLIAWRLYVKELDALELDAAPEIEWPPRPQN